MKIKNKLSYCYKIKVENSDLEYVQKACQTLIDGYIIKSQSDIKKIAIIKKPFKKFSLIRKLPKIYIYIVSNDKEDKSHLIKNEIDLLIYRSSILGNEEQTYTARGEYGAKWTSYAINVDDIERTSTPFSCVVSSKPSDSLNLLFMPQDCLIDNFANVKKFTHPQFVFLCE